MSPSRAVRAALSALLAAALLATAPAFAQESESEDAEANPLAPPDTSSPRATLRSFLDNVEAAFRPYYLGQIGEEDPFGTPAGQRTLHTLDLSEVPPAQASRTGKETVLLLAEVLARVGLPPDEEVPGAEELAELPDGARRVWRIPATAIEIVMVEEGPRQGEYLFSASTVKRIRGDYELARTLPYRPDTMVGLYQRVVFAPGRLIPHRLVYSLPYWARRPIGNQAPWQWAALALGLAVWVALGALALNLARSRAGAPRRWRAVLLTLLLIPVTSALRHFVDHEVKLVGIPFEFLDSTLVLASFLLAAAVSVRVGTALGETIVASPRIDPRSIDAHLIRMVSRSLGWIGALVLALVGAAQIGAPLTALITSLGVGGFAFALAARPTLENLVAGVTLFIDRPVRVGTFCAFEGVIGQVEEIGLRSTKVRRWGGNRITIPNAQFAEFMLDNYDDTNDLWIRETLNLRYETTPDQLRWLLAKLRELLVGHPRLTGTPRARLAGFGEHALRVEILTYADTGNWMEWHAIREDVFLRIMDLVEESGTSFALPAQTTYLARDKGVDAERGQRVEETVQRWRESEALPFPDMSEAEFERLRGSVEFPPQGSVARQRVSSGQSPPEDS